MKVELDPRKCGIRPSPLKTVVVPRTASYRVRRTLDAAHLRALETGTRNDADRIQNMLKGILPIPQEAAR